MTTPKMFGKLGRLLDGLGMGLGWGGAVEGGAREGYVGAHNPLQE